MAADVDMARRKTVMSRSMKLGHCVCNPKKPCPCDVFTQYGVCQCAGEKLPVRTGDIALTKHVRKAGCASKIGQADLLRVLGNLPSPTDPNVLVGTAAGDDAGVYRISDTQALVQTVDVFAPCVDNPRLFGRIAAANSVSDVYAMGGRPITALSVVGFPIDELDGQVMEAMLHGAVEKLDEAGCPLIGGHSINDEEIKLGFAVTGLIDPRQIVERNKASAGDVLVLTKPLGTGMISFAAQIGRVTSACLEEVGASMATLNKDASELMIAHGAHACTDVTGYGLAGHLVEMVRNSGVSAEIDLPQLPVFAAAADCLENDILSGAVERNQAYAMAWIETDGAEEADLPILYDPQTSGGLLISLGASEAKAFLRDMCERGRTASIIGRVVATEKGKQARVRVGGGRLSNFTGTVGGVVMSAEDQRQPPAVGVEPATEEEASGCCADAAAGEQTDAAATLSMFQNFMKEANRPGRIDQRVKKLMAVALSISQRCEPCLKIHMKSALSMGITREELDEAANLATAFGGCTAMMFYEQIGQQFQD